MAIINKQENGGTVVFTLEGNKVDAAKEQVNQIFENSGYKLIKEQGSTYVYEKGSRIMRLLFGAFVTYHKQSVTIENQGDVTKVMLNKSSSGFSGGLIGVAAVKKEFNRLKQEIENDLSL